MNSQEYTPGGFSRVQKLKSMYDVFLTGISREVGGGGLRKNLSCGRDIACENIRFSTLIATGDVLHRGTSATQRQKFHTNDVKSVWNPVRSADWSME